MAETLTRSSLIALIVVAMLCGCDGSNGAAPSTVTSALPSTSTTVLRCGVSQENCTSEQVIAAVAQLFVYAGRAAAAEAACLAPITGRGTNAVNQALDEVSPAQTRSAIACVGSEARLRAIIASLATYSPYPFGAAP